MRGASLPLRNVCRSLKKLVFGISLTAFLCGRPGLASAQPVIETAWRITDSRPFSGRAVGVVGAAAYRASGRSGGPSFLYTYDRWLKENRPKTVQWLTQKGFWKPGQRFGWDLLVVAPVSERKARQTFGPGTIAFRTEGFPESHSARVLSFLRQHLPVLTEIYGDPIASPPGSSRQVTIVLDELLDALDGGVYNAVTDEIRIAEFDPGRASDWFNLIHQVLHAFRGPLLLSFPSWEEGTARAAALMACMRLRNEGVAELRNFDPKDPFEGDPLWILPLYDWLNQPPLGSPFFVSPTGFEPMAFWRIGASASAWLKVATEDRSFFRKFNEALVRSPDPLALRGDTPALVDFAASLVSTVEGRTFHDWYRRQWVLNTGISVGPKLYVFAVPQHIGIVFILHHFRTTPQGDEQPLSGIARLIYRNDQSSDLYSEEGNEVDIIDGEGIIAPQFFNIGGPNLILVDIFANNLATTIPFPYMVRGEEPTENPVWGGVVGSLSGSLTVRFNERTELTASVQRGVFAITQGLDVGTFYRLEVSHRDPSGFSGSVRLNSAFDITGLILLTHPAVVRRTLTLDPGIHLFANPLSPPAADEAAALGIPPDRLLLAHWNPTRAGFFKYEFYPRLSTPMAPGIGYWLKLFDQTTLIVEGAPINPQLPYEVPIFGGFNQLGNPYADPPPLSASQILVAYGSEGPVPLTEAERLGWVQKSLWTWTAQTGYRISESIQPWHGFWMRCLRPSGVRVIFPGERRRQFAQRIASVAGEDEPKGPIFGLRVEAPGSPPDEENWCGLLSDQPVPPVWKPPPLPGTIYSGFLPADGKGRGETISLLACDYRQGGPGQRWLFVVRSDLPNSVGARLSWRLSPDWQRQGVLTITDRHTGKTVSPYQISSYSFEMTRGEERQFIIESRPVSKGPMVFIRRIQRHKGGGFSAEVTVSGPAHVRTDLISLTGRLLRTADERFVPSISTFTISWNPGRVDLGPLPMPCLIRVQATDLSGRSRQAARLMLP